MLDVKRKLEPDQLVTGQAKTLTKRKNSVLYMTSE